MLSYIIKLLKIKNLSSLLKTIKVRVKKFSIRFANLFNLLKVI